MFKFVLSSVLNSSANVALYDYLRNKGLLSLKMEATKDPKEKALGVFPIYLDGVLIIPDVVYEDDEIELLDLIEKNLGKDLFSAVSSYARLLIYETKFN